MADDKISYSKLIRDNIPEALEAEGFIIEAEKVSDDRIFHEVLTSKLEEETIKLSETAKKDLLEGLAEIETIIDALIEVNGLSRNELSQIKEEKDKKDGKFNKRIYLRSTRRKS